MKMQVTTRIMTKLKNKTRPENIYVVKRVALNSI
jgi:hypothetical protein